MMCAAKCAVAASELRGVVVDPNGAAIQRAQVILRDAQQVGLREVATTPDGSYSLKDVRPGRYLLVVTRMPFAAARQLITVRDGETLTLRIVLPVAPVATEVTVTAESGRVDAVDQVAQRANIIGASEMERRFTNALVDVLREEPGVDVQRTVPGMGAVAVRGLLGKNVAVYRDGIRYTTSAQRGGVSTFFQLNDAHGLDGIEVLRGPNSAQYGSDSIGGTVHLLSQAAPAGGGWHGEWLADYGSAAHGFGSAFRQSFTAGALGVVLNLGGRRVNTLRPGAGLDSHAAVTRFLGLPSAVLGERQSDTGFTQYGGGAHAQWTLSPKHQLVMHYDRGQVDGAKRPDQLSGGDGNLIADLRNLMLDFGYLRYAGFGIAGFDHVSVTGSFNAQREERVNQGGNGNALGAITYQYEKTRVWGANGLASKQIGAHQLVFGADSYREGITAPSFTFNPSTGVTAAARPRIPDGASYWLYGLFAQDAWQLSRKLRVSGALRWGGIRYEGLGEQVRTSAPAGRVGVVYAPVEAWRIFANYSRGFRAPSVTDLGTLGLQGNGFFEASFRELSGRGATIGDRADDRATSTGRPIEPVRPETSDNYEGGVAWRGSRVRAELSGFWMNLGNTIVSQTLILPPGAVGSPLGDQVVNRQLPSGAIFVAAATAPVLIRSNFGGAQTYGVEQSSEVRLSRAWTFAENLTWLYARDRRTGLPPDIEGGTPPLTANVRLRWAPGNRRWWVESYGVFAGRQERLSSLALADRRVGAARSRANIASYFNNGAVARGLVANGVLSSTGETLTAVQTRVLGAANSAPMFTAIPGYGLVGVRSGWRIGERSRVFIDASNILDQRHRGISWGVDGAGRAVTVSYRVEF